MIGRMRPFYQAHWEISNDIKHIWLLFCTYYIAWVFQWILGDEERGGEMIPPLSVQGVDHPVCCVLDAVVTYARGSSCWFQEGLLSSRGGGGGGADILAPGLHQYVCSLEIEPTAFALLTQCSTTEPQEHGNPFLGHDNMFSQISIS